jgi:hypothetical protein
MHENFETKEEKYFYAESYPEKKYRYTRLQQCYTQPRNTVERSANVSRTVSAEEFKVAENKPTQIVAGDKPTEKIAENKTREKVAENKPTEELSDIKFKHFLERLEAIESKSINLQDLIWGYYITKEKPQNEAQIAKQTK